MCMHVCASRHGCIFACVDASESMASQVKTPLLLNIFKPFSRRFYCLLLCVITIPHTLHSIQAIRQGLSSFMVFLWYFPTLWGSLQIFDTPRCFMKCTFIQYIYCIVGNSNMLFFSKYNSLCNIAIQLQNYYYVSLTMQNKLFYIIT